MGVTKGYFSIWGCYEGKWEKLDDARDNRSAEYLAGEYQLAFGRDWHIEIRHKGSVWLG